jgi:hypothetical protein
LAAVGGEHGGEGAQRQAEGALGDGGVFATFFEDGDFVAADEVLADDRRVGVGLRMPSMSMTTMNSTLVALRMAPAKARSSTSDALPLPSRLAMT